MAIHKKGENDVVYTKSGSELVSPDKHKTKAKKGRFLPLLAFGL